MAIDNSIKTELSLAGVNDTVRRHFEAFYADYGFVSESADIEECYGITFPSAEKDKPGLAAVALKGTVMNGRVHTFEFAVHRFNHGPFSDGELRKIAEMAGVPSDVVIIEEHEEDPNRRFSYTPYGGRIYYDLPSPAAAS